MVKKLIILTCVLSILRRYGHVTQMSNKQTAKQLTDLFSGRRRPKGQFRTRGRIMLKTWPGLVYKFHR